jgi:hypothetical protein
MVSNIAHLTRAIPGKPDMTRVTKRPLAALTIPILVAAHRLTAFALTTVVLS